MRWMRGFQKNAVVAVVVKLGFLAGVRLFDFEFDFAGDKCFEQVLLTQ
jgi:hypothetical protein